MCRIPSLLTCLLIVAAALSVSGQTISIKPATFDDFKPLLQSKGYDAFVFDISKMGDRKVKFDFTIREYEGDSLVKDNVLSWTPSYNNMLLLTDIGEQYRQSFIDSGLDDAEKGIVNRAGKITIGLMPGEADSLKRFMINVDKMGSCYAQLTLKPQKSLDSDKVFYSYDTRPFKLENSTTEGYVPLLLLGSIWYDERFNIYRFCGENELDPDLTVKKSMVHNIPHFFVFGVDIHPVD